MEINKKKCSINKGYWDECKNLAKDFVRTHSGDGWVCEEHLNKKAIFDKDWKELCPECNKPLMWEEPGAKIALGEKTYHSSCYFVSSIKSDIKNLVKKKKTS